MGEKKEDGKKDDEKKPMSRDDYVSTMEGNCSKPCAPEYFGLVAKFDKKYFDKYPGRSCGELDTFIIKDCVKHGYDVKKFTAMCGYCIPSYNEAKFRFDIMMGPGDDPKKDDEKKEDEKKDDEKKEDEKKEEEKKEDEKKEDEKKEDEKKGDEKKEDEKKEDEKKEGDKKEDEKKEDEKKEDETKEDEKKEAEKKEDEKKEDE